MAYKIFSNGDVLNASEINENLMNQSVIVFTNDAARSAAIPSPIEGMTTYIEATKRIQYYDGSAWTTLPSNGYQYVDTVYFNSTGTFSKATYPWLRAVKVTTVGGGGGSAGCGTTTASQVKIGRAGGGSATAERFIEASTLAASVSVAVGAAGAAGAAGDNDGGDGGRSSFALGTAYEVSANGGVGGQLLTATSFPVVSPAMANTTTGVGDLVSVSGIGTSPIILSTIVGHAGRGGFNAMFPAPSPETRTNSNGAAADQYGNGGQASLNFVSQGTTRSGGAGFRGIVIVDLFA